MTCAGTHSLSFLICKMPGEAQGDGLHLAEDPRQGRKEAGARMQRIALATERLHAGTNTNPSKSRLGLRRIPDWPRVQGK